MSHEKYENVGKIKLFIGEKEVKMIPFVADTFVGVIKAFTKNLKGHNGGKIRIEIDE